MCVCEFGVAERLIQTYKHETMLASDNFSAADKYYKRRDFIGDDSSEPFHIHRAAFLRKTTAISDSLELSARVAATLD